ncbi:hypothetical protein LEMLEM_LOCUS7526 [Lemmus lemmus]
MATPMQLAIRRPCYNKSAWDLGVAVCSQEEEEDTETHTVS